MMAEQKIPSCQILRPDTVEVAVTKKKRFVPRKPARLRRPEGVLPPPLPRLYSSKSV
jgi:hypothetical protein